MAASSCGALPSCALNLSTRNSLNLNSKYFDHRRLSRGGQQSSGLNEITALRELRGYCRAREKT